MDIGSIIGIITSIVGVSSMVTSALPNKNEKGKRIFSGIMKILNVLAFNFGHARNYEDM